MNVVQQRMQAEQEALAPIGCGNMVRDFVLRHGKAFTPAPFTGERMVAKRCFTNAIYYALERPAERLLYAEGFATIPGVPMLFEHAWCVTQDGTVVDPTWRDPQECVYFGVAFEPAGVAEQVMRQGWHGLLSNYSEMANEKFLTQCDKGEVPWML